MGLHEQIQTVKAQQEAQRAKREQPDHEEDKKDKDVARPTKKTVISEVIQVQRRGVGIPIEELIASPAPFSYESPPAQSRVSWAPQPKEDSLPLRASASSKKTASTPSPLSKGSTIPFTHTPSVVKGVRNNVSIARIFAEKSLYAKQPPEAFPLSSAELVSIQARLQRFISSPR
jgi:hypothetical protein